MTVPAVRPSCAKQTAEAMSSIATKTDTTNKFIKVVISIAEVILSGLSFVPGTEAAKAGLGILKGRLNDAKSVINAAGILERPADWVRNKDLRDGSNWQKTANRVALTAGQSMELVGFVDKVSLGFFSQAALSIGGVLPIFDMVKNVLFGVAAVFSIACSSKDLKKANGKETTISAKLVSVRTAESDAITNKYALTDKSYKNADAENIRKYKIEKYETQLADIKNTRTKNWVNIAAEVAKITMIVLGMSVVLLALTFPVLTVPAAVLVMSSLGLVANTLGLTKNLYEALNPNKTNKIEFLNKHFAAPAA